MNRRKFWHILALAAILMGIVPLTVSAARPDWSKVDPLVLDRLSQESTTLFHVVMAVQSDLSGAAALPTKAEKGAYVFELLTRTARETQAPILAYLAQQGLTYRSRYIYNMIEVEGNLITVAWLAGRADVARVSAPPNAMADPVFDLAPADEAPNAVEWNITRVGAPDVWAMGFHGEGYVVASNDTGARYTHNALVNHYRGNLGGGSFDHNYNWWGGAGSTAPVDNDGHGTHTIGTMVGDDGGTNQIGVAPGAKWISCAGLGGADVVDCFEFFLAPWDLNQQNADPGKAPDSINNSWYDPSSYDYRPIIQTLNAAGIAVIKSAGNTGPNCGTISNPGYVPEIIATAAFNSSDVIASFSARGPMSNYGDTILKPEVAAPGVGVRSSYNTSDTAYTNLSGTSMAAPHTTALVALMWNAAPCIAGDVPLTKQIMMDTAEAKIDAQCPPFVDHPNDVWGWGILDMPAAVQLAMTYCGDMGALEGYVYDDTTLAPINAASVTAAEPGGFVRTVQTDASGYYTMTALVGTYTVTAAHPWYTTGITTGIEVVTDTATQVDFYLTMQSYIVSGTVTHAYYGTPIADATVTAEPGGASATTDPAGYYELLLTAGTYDLTAAKDGYTTEVAEDVVVPDTNLVDFELNSAVLSVTPDALHASVHSSDTVTLTLNIANPGGLDLFFEIAETTATMRYVGQDVIVRVPASAGYAGADARVPAAARPASTVTMHVGWVSLQAIDVLLVTPDVAGGGDISWLLTALAAFPDLVVTTWDGSTGTPTVADMAAYDVVFVGNDILWTSSAIDVIALSNNLADYIDAGGKVLVSSFIWSYDEWGMGAGRFITEDYSPFEVASNDYWDPIALGDYNPAHPIMAGITNITEGYNHQDPALSSNGTWVASWADDENFVAVAPNCVGLNALYFNAAIPGGQSGELLHNALLFLAAGMAPVDVPWVSEVPVSGTVAAGTDLDVDVVFTALAPYHLAGDYTATLVISHDDPVAADAVQVPITMTVFECTVVDGPDFTWMPADPLVGESVTFTGTVAAGEPPLTYTWDLGDGNVDEGEVVTHVYDAAGTYTVTMTAANACPSEASVAYVLTVAEPPCDPPVIESIGGGVDGCVADLFAVVTGTAPFAYLWDFAAFGTYTTAGVMVDFGASGSYPYTLTVNNDCGEDIHTETLVVTCTPPCEDVQIVSYDYDASGCVVDFNLELTGTAPFTYLWAFGDGMTSTVAMPRYTYDASGTYSVTVEVWNCADEGHAMETFPVTVDCAFAIYLPVVFK